MTCEDVRFYIGNPCKRGHDGRRYSNCGSCVECSIQCSTKRNATPKVRAQRNVTARQPAAKAAATKYRQQPHVVAKRAERRRWYKYDLLPVEYNFMLAGQGFCCATCGADEPGGKYGKWHTDHCHKTGKVRGILCQHCNLGLGHFKDSPELLQAAIEYLCPTNSSTKLTSETDGRQKPSLHIEQNESRHTNWSAGLL